MPNEDAVADQPTATPNDGAEETSSSDPYVPTFMRDEPEPEPEAEETPETQTAEETGEEVVEESETGDTPQEDSQPDEHSSLLASLTPAETAYYAKRYPTLYAAVQDPNQPADLRQAFVDRVNQDHAYAELRDAKDEEEEGEPTSEATPPASTEEASKQYYAQIDDIVTKQIDQQKVNELGSQLLGAMGVDLKSEDPDIQAIVKNAPKVGQVLARGALDLMSTTLPNILMSRMEVAMPGISEMYYDNLRARTWEGIRSRTVKGPDGAPSKPYAKLPEMGTPQWDQAVDKVLTEMPELREMYAELPPQQRFQKQYAIAAKLMTEQRVDPALMAQAVETGKKLARSTVTRRATGKVLGAGKPTGEARRTSGNDDLFGPGIEEYQRRGG